MNEFIKRYPGIADVLRSAIPVLRLTHGATDELARRGISSRSQLGDFRVLRQIGRGGMGVFYEAEQISMGRRVALKVLPLVGLVGEQRIQRFQNEVRAVAALDHPNIVPVYTIGEDRGVHYYAMKMIRGCSLAQVISSLREVRGEGQELDGQSVIQIAKERKSDGVKLEASQQHYEDDVDQDGWISQFETAAKAGDSTLSDVTRQEFVRSISALGIQAAMALQHAHDQGIVHRDVKPANLLLDASSKLFVTDFGLARIEADAGVTMTGDLVGTLRYMAPEQALGKRVVVDHRADIYSLAVTLYELLTLQPAYSAEDRQQLLTQIAFEQPTSLRRIDPEIPAELETIVHKAMSKDIDDRYSSAQEFADDLRSFLEHRPIKAKPPTLTQVAAKWARRNPAIAWASIVTLSLVALAFGISTLVVSKQRDIAVRQLRIATVSRLAAESRALQDERSMQSVLLAVEAVELSQQRDTPALPIAHEALLNASQRLPRGRTLKGHGTSISALAFGSDWLVTLGDGKAHLWDLTSSARSSLPRPLGRDNDRITSMALSEDGRWLVTGGSKLQRWDLKAQNPDLAPFVFSVPDIPITSLGLGPVGRWLVAQTEDGTVRLWDLNAVDPTASMILSRHAELFEQFAVSADGRWIAAATDRIGPPTPQLWDVHADDKSTLPFFLKGHKEGIRSMVMSPDSRWLVTGSRDHTVRLWNLKSETPQNSSRVLRPAKRGGVIGLLITPDNRCLSPLRETLR